MLVSGGYLARTMIGIYAIAWIPMAFLAIVNGGLRERWYGRHMTELGAHRLSTLIAGVLFFGYTGFLGLLWPIASAGQAFAIGGIWLVLTVVFEFCLGRLVLKETWSRLLMDYNLPKGRVWVLLLAWLFLLPYVVMVFSGVGYPKNAKQRNAEQQAVQEWIPPPLPEVLIYDPEPLLIQVSRDPVVYMSHIPEAQVLTDFEEENGIVIMPSRIEDVFLRIVKHKAAQEALQKTASILLTGDDLADCGSVIRVVEDAKRAGIEWIVFEPWYRATGEVGRRVETGECVALRYFDFSKETKNDSQNSKESVSITLRQDDVILWGDAPVSLEEFVNKLEDERGRISSENIRVTVYADAKASYAPLRWMLGQLQRATISKVMLKLR